MIFYLEENRIFVLETENTHYVFGIDPAGYNRHLHWGAKCDPADYAFTEIGDENSNHSMLDEYRQELTPFGSTVYRTCDLKAQFADGCREVALRYTGYRLEDDTLRVAFEDAYYPLQVRLGYRVYPGLDIIKRWVEVENTGSAPISFERLFSAGFSLPGMDPYTLRIPTVLGAVNSCPAVRCWMGAIWCMRATVARPIIISRRILSPTAVPRRPGAQCILAPWRTAAILR